MIIGNLGADPEIRYTQTGTPVATLNIATNENWSDKGGNRHEHTEWHRVILWRRLAEIAGEFLTKGSKIHIEGKIQTRKWQDSDGVDRYATEIIGQRLEMLSGNKQNDGRINQTDNPQPDDDFPPF